MGNFVPKVASARFLRSEVCIFERNGKIKLYIEDYDNFNEQDLFRALTKLRIQEVKTVHTSDDPVETWLDVRTATEQKFSIDYQFEGLNMGIYIYSDSDALMEKVCEFIDTSDAFDLYDERFSEDDYATDDRGAY